MALEIEICAVVAIEASGFALAPAPGGGAPAADAAAAGDAEAADGAADGANDGSAAPAESKSEARADASASKSIDAASAVAADADDAVKVASAPSARPTTASSGSSVAALAATPAFLAALERQIAATLFDALGASLSESAGAARRIEVAAWALPTGDVGDEEARVVLALSILPDEDVRAADSLTLLRRLDAQLRAAEGLLAVAAIAGADGATVTVSVRAAANLTVVRAMPAAPKDRLVARSIIDTIDGVASAASTPQRNAIGRGVPAQLSPQQKFAALALPSPTRPRRTPPPRPRRR
jgi:hypothetical protein